MKIHIAPEAVVERVGYRGVGQVAVRVILEKPIVQESVIKNLVAIRIEIARNGNRHRRCVGWGVKLVIGRDRNVVLRASLAVRVEERRWRVIPKIVQKDSPGTIMNDGIVLHGVVDAPLSSIPVHNLTQG